MIPMNYFINRVRRCTNDQMKFMIKNMSEYLDAFYLEVFSLLSFSVRFLGLCWCLVSIFYGLFWLRCSLAFILLSGKYALIRFITFFYYLENHKFNLKLIRNVQLRSLPQRNPHNLSIPILFSYY